LLVNVIRFSDGPTQCEVWELPDAGWDDWASQADVFLAYAIQGMSAAYLRESIEWLEVNYWPDTARLIVFPSSDPYGDRGERVCFQLCSSHLQTAFDAAALLRSEAEQDAAWDALCRGVWSRVSECLLVGEASRELKAARAAHRMRVAGYDYCPGEGLCWLGEDGSLIA
jgi:hypothetical protein